MALRIPFQRPYLDARQPQELLAPVAERAFAVRHVHPELVGTVEVLGVIKGHPFRADRVEELRKGLVRRSSSGWSKVGNAMVLLLLFSPASAFAEAVVRARRHPRQWCGVAVPDLVDALGELPAVTDALVAVVVDGVVQL
jgi:hypothetical protein